MTVDMVSRVLAVAEKKENALAIVLAREVLRLLQQRDHIMNALRGNEPVEAVEQDVTREMIDDIVREYVEF